MLPAFLSLLLRLPYRPTTFPEFIGQVLFSVVALSFFLYVYVSIRFGSKSPPAPAPPAATVPAATSKAAAEVAVVTSPQRANALSEEARMEGFLAKLDKELYNNILGADPARVEGVYKHDRRTTNWEGRFFRYLDQRKFKHGFYDTQYVCFHHGPWQVTVLFHNKRAVRCAVVGMNWHHRPFLDKVLPIKEWTEAATGRSWSFAMNENQFWLTACS